MKVSFVYKFDNVDKEIPVSLYNVRHIRTTPEHIRIIERDNFHYATYDRSRISGIIEIKED